MAKSKAASRSLNIAFFIYSLQCGGAERVVSTLANSWAIAQWKVTIITIIPQDKDFYSLHRYVQREVISIHRNRMRLLGPIINNMRYVVKLRKVLNQINPDAAIGMMPTSGILLTLASLGLVSIQIICSERTYPPMVRLGVFWTFLRWLIYPLANNIVMLTDDGLAWLSEKIPNAVGTVIANPVGYPLQASYPRIMPSMIVNPNRRIILSVGRLTHEKGFDRLIEAMSLVFKTDCDWDLVIVGEGQERQKLHEKVTSFGLNGRIFLPGTAGNMADWYHAAEIYVLTSRFEGFPNALCEAMAHGCAVVSYDCLTGPRDIIDDEVNGLLVREGDILALSFAIQRLISADDLRKKIGNAARNVAIDYSIKSISERWEKLFRSY